MRVQSTLLTIALGLAIAGCGGSGGNVGGGGGPGAANVPIFATDAPSPDFDHVWVRIFSIDLIPAAGAPVNIFTSSTGLVVDARSLRDNAGAKFQFLDSAGVPAGSYTGAKVTTDKHVGVVMHGHTTTDNDQFDDASNGTVAGQSVFSFTFTPPFVASTNNPVVLDFDLANWSIDNSGRVHAVVKRGNASGAGDSNRQQNSNLEGITSGLTGTVGNQTFTLTGEHGRSVTVTVTQNTVIFNDDGSTNPVLANNERVHVVGTFSNGVFTASSIRIQRGNVNNEGDEVEGTASNIDATAGTFTLTIGDTEDFVPTQTTLTVTTSTSTNFFVGGISMTEADFFTALAAAPAGTEVHVMGTVSGGTLAATVVRIEDATEHHGHNGGGEGRMVEVSGAASNISALGGSLTITVADSEGTSLTVGATVNVVTTANTEFKNGENNLSAADFFAALTTSSNVVAEGTLSNGTLTATELNIGSITTGHGGHGHGGGDH